MNGGVETEEITTLPINPYLLQRTRTAGLAQL